ncbi:MAG: hypothetical protein JJE52_04510 [Acidimicrobiia bacterium]|nr:hypothetical protein [Acidimicrobiia bacterium]
MTELDQHLRGSLGRLATARQPTDDGNDRVVAIHERVRRRRRGRLAAGIGVPLVAVVAVAALAWPGGDDHTAVLTDPHPTSTSQDTVAATTTTDDVADPPEGAQRQSIPGVTKLDTGPLSPRLSPALLWTDDRLLVWGGWIDQNFGFDESRAFVDGALYDPGSGTWTTITDAPLEASHKQATAVWTGDRVIAAGGRRLAAWDPATDRWTDLGSAPGSVDEAVWTGEEVLTIERWQFGAALEDVTWGALDPASGRWRELPPPPIALEGMTVTWTGDELIVLGKPLDVRFYAPAEGMAYDPATDSWRRLPTAPVDAQALASTWRGDRLLAVNYDMGAATYDPEEDSWTELPQVPASFSEGGTRATTSGDQSIVSMWFAIVVRNAHDEWVPAPDIIGLGGTGMAGSDDGRVFAFGLGGPSDPPANAFHILELPVLAQGRSIQVGNFRLDLPDDAAFVEAVGSGLSAPNATVTARVSVRQDECEITHHGGTNVVSRPGGKLLIEPTNGGTPWAGHLSADGTSISVGMSELLDTTDIYLDSIEITCLDPATTRELARFIQPLGRG